MTGSEDGTRGPLGDGNDDGGDGKGEEDGGDGKVVKGPFDPPWKGIGTAMPEPVRGSCIMKSSALRKGLDGGGGGGGLADGDIGI